MDLVYPRCAGIDIAKQSVMVCVRVAGPDGRARTTVEEWASSSSQILRLAERLTAEEVTRVVMEATGDYWKPWFFLLSEAGLDVVLANPRQVKQIPGRKTDVGDAVWLADLAAHDLVKGSFVPDRAARELKDLVRLRATLVKDRARHAQRLEKVLVASALTLSGTISDILGVSGRAMLEALIEGEHDPEALARLAHRKVKAGQKELAEALTGRFTEHHACLARSHLRVIDMLSEEITVVEGRVEAYFTPDGDPPGGVSADREWRQTAHDKRELLMTIPAVKTVTATAILSELGLDWSMFPTAGHLASWAGVAPGSNQSGGRSKPARARKGNTFLKGYLSGAALAVTRAKGTFLQARYRRLRSNRGAPKALVAVARSVIEAAWLIMTTDQPYLDLGGDYYDRRKPANAIRTAINRLLQAGCVIDHTAKGIYLIAPPAPA